MRIQKKQIGGYMQPAEVFNALGGFARKVLDSAGFDKGNIKRTISDLRWLGILPPENNGPYNMGIIAPGILDGAAKAEEEVAEEAAKEATKAISKTTKIRNLEKAEDKAMRLNKNVRLKGKFDKSYEKADARHTNSGQSRVRNQYNGNIESVMRKYAGWGKKLERLDLRAAKIEATTKDKVALDKINKERKALINEFKSIYYRKSGGSLYKFKKGNKIHIKESQRGSFTKYCNGKVTEECIQKGKNSPNPKIRKKATFAQNSRHFKHQEGGNIISSEGVDALTGIVGNLFGGISTNKAIKQKRKAINAQSAYAKNAARSQVMGQAQESENQKAVQQLQQFNENSDNGRPSEIVSQANAYSNAMKILPSYYNQIDQETNAQLADLQALKQQNTANMINGIVSAGVQYGQDSGLFDKWNQNQLVKQFEKNAKNNLSNIKINNNAPKISTGGVGLI